MSSISLIDVASYLPETIVREDFFGAADGDAPRKRSPMFASPTERRHVREGESAVDMIERAGRTLFSRLNLDAARDVDIILTNVSVPDQFFTGCGAEVSHRLGTRAQSIIDLHNTGCVSFIYMLELARVLMKATPARSALICNVQNGGGRVYAHPLNRTLPQAVVPGDGCGVGYVTASDESPVLSLIQRVYNDSAADMRVVSDDQQPYWAPRSSALHIDFSERKVVSIVRRGNRIVPEVIGEACRAAEIKPTDVDLLVTNQPNTVFLRNWREALEVPAEKHADTFDQYGNLFGAAIPITLDEAVRGNRVRAGGLVALGGFSHAGDYAAGAIIRWRTR